MDNVNWQVLGVVLGGCVGGFANAYLSDALMGTYWETIKTKSGKKIRGLRLGTIGNVFIGGVGSFVAWSVGLYTHDQPDIYGIAILSGYGGAHFLKSMFDNQFSKVERDMLVDAIEDERENTP